MSNEIKHLFYSHSWITQLVIEAYIDKKQLAHQNITIFSNRSFYECVNPHLKDRFVNIRKLKFPNWLHVVMFADKLRRFSQWFKNITEDDKFVLYVPHFYPIEIKMMVRNENCLAVYLIEEGAISYRSSQYINSLKNHNYQEFTEKYLNFFWSRKLSSVFSLQTIDNEIIDGTIQMFNEAFPYSKNKIVLQNEIGNIVRRNFYFNFEIKCILVLTPYVDVLKLTPEIYFKDLERVMYYIIENTEDIIHYKFHPSDSEFVKQRTNQLAEKFGDRFVQISDSISLEAILLKSKPTVYTCLSSISIYAFLLDCKLNIMIDFIQFTHPDLNINDINLSSYVIPSPKI